DNDNNIIITGTFTGSCDFDPGTGVATLLSAGSMDIFLAKYNGAGNYLWAIRVGAALADDVFSIALDTTSYIYITGGFYNTVDFDPGAGLASLTSAGSKDIYVAKYDAEGNYVNAIALGSVNIDEGNVVSIDGEGNVLVGGGFTNTIDFDASASVFNITSNGSRDIFLALYSNTFSFKWAKAMGGDDYETLKAISLDASDNIYITGGFEEIADFDPSAEFTLIEDGGEGADTEIYFAKYLSCPIAYYADVDADGFGDPFSSDSICEDIPPIGFVLNSFDCNDANSLVNPDATEICNSIDDDCDGMMDDTELIATITPAGATVFCKPGSVVLNANTGAGYTYQWKKNGVNIPGATLSSYTATMTKNYSVIITAGLCVDESDVVAVTAVDKPNAAITNVETTNDLCFDSSIKLKTSNVAGYTYQWYKGATGISGATSNVYLATTPGNYKVRVTNALGCFKISPPYAIIETCKLGSGIYAHKLLIYPNPASETINFEISTGYKTNIAVEIVIINSLGENIYEGSSVIQNGSLIENISLKNIPAGIYNLEIYNEEFQLNEQFMLSK
ncbi:MAG: T9SS type A sorting domain-containing protein, partial [Chitinophagales bacterium]|nr:T9SS type A sorting domain-containing protein [Chitinophagales bacterium]